MKRIHMRLNNTKKMDHFYKHVNDDFTGLGFDYHGNIFKRTLSKEMFVNENQNKMMRKMEIMIEYLVDAVKQIKLQFSIALDKDSTKIN